MARIRTKKPVDELPDDQKHEAAESLEEKGAQSRFGHEPDPEEVTGADRDEPKTNIDAAHEMGIYDEADESDPEEVDIAKQVEENDEA